jgi:CBS domain-containing protein
MFRTMPVGDLIDRDYATVRADTPIDAVPAALSRAPYGELFVVDGENHLVGTIRAPEICVLMTADPRPADAGALADPSSPLIDAAADPRAALMAMDAARTTSLPVVRDTTSRELLGVVHEHAVVLAYHRALIQARGEEHGRRIPRRKRRRATSKARLG